MSTSPDTTIRPTYQPRLLDDGKQAGTLILRDGSRLMLSRSLPEDARQIEALLERLPRGERTEVLRALGLQDKSLPGFLDGLAHGQAGVAFHVRGGAEEQIVAFGAYRCEPGQRDAAGVTLAVEPRVRKMGLATLLLERLAVTAASRGINRLVGVAQAGNEPLIALFRAGGFEVDVREQEGGSASFQISTPAPDASDTAISSRAFTAASLRPLFFPSSIAVVGASREPGSVGNRLLDSLIQHRFNGPVYPVNPKAHHVLSVRAYPSVTAIGEPVDLAVIIVPARLVSAVVDECATIGVRALIVISAGFAETGEEGTERQRVLLEQVKGYGMRMVGPNCLGVIHTAPEVLLNASFSPLMPAHGSVGLCSQSGALGIAIIALTQRLGLGLSSFVSVGNKADISGNDLLEFWEEDETTRVILFYLESLGNPRRFARLARRVGRSKPIVMVKAGRTSAGSRAASSHTAALSAADTAVDALFRQSGVIRANTLEEMFAIAQSLTAQPLPPGRRVAVVTNAGGPAILCTDSLEAAGMKVEPLGEATQARLRAFLPEEASTTNPVDLIASGGPEAFRRAVEELLVADEVDALVVIYTPVDLASTDDVAEAVLAALAAARQRGARNKPVLSSIFGGASQEVVTLSSPAVAEVVPVYPFPETIGRLLGKLCDYAEWRAADTGVFPEFSDQELSDARSICQRALSQRGAGWLSIDEALTVLQAAGLRVAPGGVAKDPEEAAAIAERVGFPVAVKLASLELVHKTEIGGVALGLASAAAVREAFVAMREGLERTGQAEAMQGVLVQPMLSGGSEVMIGVDEDPGFGPVIAFGLGGIHVEILRDVVFRVSPLTDVDAQAMVRGIKGYRLLEGYRGHPPADTPALEEALLRISRLVEAVAEIKEIDLNPIFALAPGQGYRVVDARIKVGPSKR